MSEKFLSFKQNNWTKWLPIAVFSYNNTLSSSTKFTPFFSLNSYHPRFNSLVDSSGISASDKFVAHIQGIQEELIDNLTQVKILQSNFYDQESRIAVCYKTGDLVWLSRKNLKTRQVNSKLDVRRIGPFEVKRMVGKNAADLILPPHLSRLHSVLNVSLLMPFISNEKEDHSSSIGPYEDFAKRFVEFALISHVLDYKCYMENIREYLIRGDDHSGIDNEW